MEKNVIAAPRGRENERIKRNALIRIHSHIHKYKMDQLERNHMTNMAYTYTRVLVYDIINIYIIIVYTYTHAQILPRRWYTYGVGAGYYLKEHYCRN